MKDCLLRPTEIHDNQTSKWRENSNKARTYTPVFKSLNKVEFHDDDGEMHQNCDSIIIQTVVG